MVNGEPQVWVRKQTDAARERPALSWVTEAIQYAVGEKRSVSIKDRLTRPRKRLELAGDEHRREKHYRSSFGLSSDRGSHPRMIKPPARRDHDWHRVTYLKFPQQEESITRTQRRRLQRQRKEVCEHYVATQVYRPKKKAASELSTEQETRSTSEEATALGIPDSREPRWERAAVDMVYLLPAQFSNNATKKVRHEPDPSGAEEAPLEVELGEAKHSTVAVSAGGICVSRNNGSNDSVTLTRPADSMMAHGRPLYVRDLLDGVPMTKVLVDNGAAINVLPATTMKKLGRSDQDLVPINVLVSSFIGDITST